MRIYKVYVEGNLVNKWYLLTWKEALDNLNHYKKRGIKDVKILDTTIKEE